MALKRKTVEKALSEMKAYIADFRLGKIKTYEYLPPTGKNGEKIRVGKPLFSFGALALISGTTEEELILYAYERNKHGEIVHKEFFHTLIDFLNVTEAVLIEGLLVGDYQPDTAEWILTNWHKCKIERIQKLKEQAQTFRYLRNCDDEEQRLPRKEEIFTPPTKEN